MTSNKPTRTGGSSPPKPPTKPKPTKTASKKSGKSRNA